MSHHLSNSLSASAASALHVVGGHVRAFAPSPRVVLSVATLASAGVLGLAAFGVTSSHTTVMLEVNGVTRPVTAWGNTVGDALEVANVSVGSGDLVQPGLAETVHEGDTIVVRSSRAYTVTVDGETRTLWTTATSADGILADAAPLGSMVALAADRSASRDELTPPGLPPPYIFVSADGTTREVAVRPGQDTRAILESAGVSVHALDRVTVENGTTGELTINVSRVTRGEATETVEIPFSETTTNSNDMFVGESQVTTTGQNGVTTWTVWQEKDGDRVLTSVPITEHSTSQPVTQVRSEGTKEVTPADPCSPPASTRRPRWRRRKKPTALPPCATARSSARFPARKRSQKSRANRRMATPPPRSVTSPRTTPVRIRVPWPGLSSRLRGGVTASISA